MKPKQGTKFRTAPQEDSENEASPDDHPDRAMKPTKTTEIWLPESTTAFKLLMSANLCSALLSNISDCDETYNYWEPMHYLLYGKGFQTWEYSPVFAIRSWAYVRMYAIMTWVHFNLMNANKLFVFYFVRTMLALICSLCEIHFYQGVSLRFGNNVARLVLGFLVFGTGMFISATAFLPSTFCMYMTFVIYGSWLQGRIKVAILAVAASSIIGWPFAAVIGLPLALDVLVRRKQYIFFAKWCLVALVTMLIPFFLIDSFYYGRPVIASVNIVLYNVFTEHGSDIYGVEDISFYLINGFLNFNFIFLLSFASLIIIPISETIVAYKITGYSSPYVLFTLFFAPMYLWILIFFTQPHKEERFLFPIYPIICLTGAVAVATIQKVYCVLKFTKYLRSEFIPIATTVVYIILCISRSAALFQGYHAPMDIYPRFEKVAAKLDQSVPQPVTVCIGKEWYRFPSHFFLPENFTLHYIKSEFRAQLPKHFDGVAPDGTRHIPSHMNDENLEEPSRYVDVKTCHFLIDNENGLATKHEPQYSLDEENWEIYKSMAFLDSSKSSSRIFRAFYIPYYFETKNSYSNYVILRSKRKKLKYVDPL